MRAGPLRHRVVIERFRVVVDEDTGAKEEDWNPIGTFWAEVKPLSGREFVAAQAVQAGVYTRIFMRMHPEVEPAMRARHLGRFYNIRAVLPDPTFRRHINLMCDEGFNEG
jgi:SPP1 family predicted phage head-tail adaptor